LANIAGDASGGIHTFKVTGIQGTAVTNTTPTLGQTLYVNGAIPEVWVLAAAPSVTGQINIWNNSGFWTPGILTAPYLTYTVGATGGVLRTQQSKNADVVNVKDFGATGAGSPTDDSSAIQAALYITNTGTGYTAVSTSATVGNGTATCTGPATIVTVLGGAQGNMMNLNVGTWIQEH